MCLLMSGLMLHCLSKSAREVKEGSEGTAVHVLSEVHGGLCYKFSIYAGIQVSVQTLMRK